jgi:hypothetical protein
MFYFLSGIGNAHYPFEGRFFKMSHPQLSAQDYSKRFIRLHTFALNALSTCVTAGLQV